MPRTRLIRNSFQHPSYRTKKKICCLQIQRLKRLIRSFYFNSVRFISRKVCARFTFRNSLRTKMFYILEMANELQRVAKGRLPITPTFYFKSCITDNFFSNHASRKKKFIANSTFSTVIRKKHLLIQLRDVSANNPSIFPRLFYWPK